MTDRSSRSCLVIKNDGVGDLILCSGLIESLARHYQGGLDVVVCEESREIAELIPGVRSIITVSRDGLRYRNRPSKARILMPVIKGADGRALAEIRNRRYDDAVCLRRFIRQSSMILMRSVRSSNKYCTWQFPTNSQPWMARRATRGWTHIPGDLSQLSELDYLAHFAQRVVGETLASEPRLRMPPNFRRSVNPKTVGLGISGTSSRWPAGYWVDFARRLSKIGWSAVLFGGNNDRQMASWIVEAVPSATNLVGSINWTESLHHLAKLEVFVGNDTGLAHLAAYAVPRCLIIHGGGTFSRFFPWPGAENQFIICHGLSCFDCDWICDYGDRHCIDLVDSKSAFDYFLEIVDDPDHTPRMRNLAAADVRFRVARQYVDDESMSRTIVSSGGLI